VQECNWFKDFLKILRLYSKYVYLGGNV